MISTLGKRLVDGLEVFDVNGDRPAAPGWLPGRAHLEPSGVGQLDQPRGLVEGVRTDALDPNLFDQVVPRGARVERRDIRRPGQKTGDAVRITKVGLEGERLGMGLPADERRRELIEKVLPDIQPAVSGPTAEPLDRATNGEVDSERDNVKGHDARGLVAVEHDARTDGVGASDDRLDVLDLTERKSTWEMGTSNVRSSIRAMISSASAQTTTSSSCWAW